jgi:hypothetical protein
VRENKATKMDRGAPRLGICGWSCRSRDRVGAQKAGMVNPTMLSPHVNLESPISLPQCRVSRSQVLFLRQFRSSSVRLSTMEMGCEALYLNCKAEC